MNFCYEVKDSDFLIVVFLFFTDRISDGQLTKLNLKFSINPSQISPMEFQSIDDYVCNS